jgi:hypothetical protein
MRQLGLYVMVVEAGNVQATQQPLALSFKTDRDTSLSNSFPRVFQEGTVTKATFKLNEGATPVYSRARPVPYASLSVVEQELDRLL